MRALTKKAFKDVTRRKLRTALTVLGIAVGVIGLSAINIASNQINSSLQYSIDQSAQPDISFITTPTDAAPMLQALQGQPNVKLAQAQDNLSARWKLPSGRFPLNIRGLADFQHLQFNTLQLVTGHFPEPDQIVLESSDRSIATIQLGSQIDVEVRGAVQMKAICKRSFSFQASTISLSAWKTTTSATKPPGSSQRFSNNSTLPC